MQKSFVCLILAKKNSKRLLDKNTLDFKGEQMFLVNVKKCLKLFKKVYVTSDSIEILYDAFEAGAIPIRRTKELCGDTPNIPVYQHALKFIKTKGIIAVQANSPSIKPGIIKKCINKLKWCNEVMTTNADGSIYGSVWGIRSKKLKNYGDPYKPQPEEVVYDPSTDIHTIKDFKKALYE